MLRSIKGEVAWVTGAGSGIGQAGAVALAKAGAKVVLTGRRAPPLEETAAMIVAVGGEAILAPADMGDSAAVEAAFGKVMDAHGRCDILVNSAGINIPKRSWAEVDIAGIDAVIGADLSGPFYASRAVMPVMRAQKSCCKQPHYTC